MKRGIPIALALGAAFVCCLAPAAATTYHNDYGTFTANTVVFHDVTEDSPTSSTALFGGPQVSGNSLTFNPTTFGAYAFDGDSAAADSALTMLVTSTGNYAIDRIVMNEQGDYTLMGSPGTAATNASVEAWLTVTVSKVDGHAISPVVFNVTGMNFTPSGGVFELPGDSGSGVIWDGSTVLDITSMLRADGYQGSATELTLAWENDLSVNSEEDTIAYIKKKEAGGTAVTIETSTVPEPVTFVGVLVGLSGLAGYIRKRTVVS